MKHVKCFLLLLLSTPIALAVESCQESGNYLSYAFNYDYNYVGEAIASSVGTTDHVAGMKYECKINLSPADKCKYILKVKECKLYDVKYPGNQKDLFQEHPSSSDFENSMKKNDVLFKLNDGESLEINHAEDEILWILNIKRAIISSFLISKSSAKQNGEWMLHTDVQGTCPQKVKRDPSNPEKLEVVKNMLFCRLPNRKYWELSPWSLFNNMSFIQHAINSTLECEYNVQNSYIQSMKCAERHAILLESTHKTTTAVQTNVKKELTLIKKSAAVFSTFDLYQTEVSKIIYEYDEISAKTSNSLDFEKEGYKMIEDLVKTTEKETRLFTITLFSKFLAHLRSSSDLKNLINGIKTCAYQSSCSSNENERAMAYLQDALVQCSTVTCVKGFKEILSDVTSFYYNFALTSWAHSYVNDPEFITEVKNICLERESRVCWLTLGSMIGNIVGKYDNLSYRQFPDGIYHPVQYLVDSLRSNCSSVDSTEEKSNHIFNVVQALGNIGNKVFKISPAVSSTLFHCFNNPNIKSDIRVEALKLRGIGPIDSSIVDKIWKILADENAHVRLRCEAYTIIANYHASTANSRKILDLFSVMKSKQVKSFIGSHIGKIISNDLRDSRRNTEYNPVFSDVSPRPFGNKELSDNLMILFEEEKYQGLLEEIKDYHGQYSKINSNSHFSELDSWRNYRNSFGFLVEDTVMYQSNNVHPSFLSSNYSFEIFDNVLNYFEAGVSSKDLLTKLNDNPKKYEVDLIFKILKEIMFGDEKSSDGFEFVGFEGISDSVVENMKEMHEKLSKLFKDEPYLMNYFKIIGKYAGFITLSDIKQISNMIQLQIVSLPSLLSTLMQGLQSHTHRNIKVIEAYHQFPTSIGMPLNWTTDASLSLSVRAGLKLDLNSRQLNLDFNPSGALTFMNSMFIVLPTIAKAGIQANSSAFTSTSWKLNGKMISNENFIINIEPPSETQEILNLFRTNFLIRGNNYEELSDFDVNRVSKSWCDEGMFKKITGLKVCHQRSYADVTNLIKPWFPMAASANWRLTFVKADPNLKSYTFKISRSTAGSSKIYRMNFEAPGTFLKRNVNAVLKTGESNELEILVPESPNFGIHFKKTKMLPSSGSTNHISFSIKDIDANIYKISYDSHALKQKMKALPKPNSLPKDKYVNAFIIDHVFNIVLPHEKYGWTYKVQKMGEDLEGNMLFSYDKLVSHTSWLEPILPEIFWEDGLMRSWVLFKAKIVKFDSFSSQSRSKGLFHLNIPKTDLEVETIRTKTSNGDSFILMAKKIEVQSKELKSFANLVYHEKLNEDDNGKGSIKTVNLTVPLHSIALDIDTKTIGSTSKYSYQFSFSKMVPKEDEGLRYVEWWDENNHKKFNDVSWKASLDISLEDIKGNWPMISKHDSISDLTSYGGHTFQQNKIDDASWLEVVLTYPVGNLENQISFKGHTISDHTYAKGLSYFRDAYLSNKLKGTTYQWQYYASWTDEKVKLFGHAAYHNRDKNINAQYRINVEHFFNPWNIQLFHSLILPDLEYFASISSQKEPKQEDIILTIQSKSDVWDALNCRLDQYFHYGDDGWESMNYTSPMFTFNVTVDWTYPWYKSYDKKMILTSHNEFVPSMQLNILYKDKGAYNADLEIKDSGNFIKLERKNRADMKATDLYFNYIENGIDKEMLWTHFVMISEHAIAGNVTYDKSPLASLTSKVYAKFHKFVAHLAKIEKDPDHQMNKFLEVFLDTKTVNVYRTEVMKMMKEGIGSIILNTYSFVKTWDVFYEPSFKIPINAWSQLKLKATQVNEVFKNTFTGWAWYYFEMPEYLSSPEFLEATKSQIMKEIINIVIIQTKDGFMYMIIHPFSWKNFDDKPEVTPELRDFISQKEVPKTEPVYPHYQTAMIYGNGNFYSFDEKFYQFYTYPVDGCMYLLAHDVENSKFTLLKNEDSIIIILQNNFYRISDDNKIYINDNPNPTALPIDVKPKNQRIDPTMATITGMNDIVQVNMSAGLYITCNSLLKQCVIKLSKEYNGKTAGLLGNFDGEAFNDFMLNDGKQAIDVYTFVASYDISGIKGCQDKALMKSKVVSCNTPSNINVQECNKMFDSNSLESTNYYCFKKVFSGPFSKACIQQSKCTDFSVCPFQSAYVAACYNAGLKIPGCDKCDQTHVLDANWYERTTREVQIALIVDQNSQMFESDKATTGLKNLLEKIDSTFLNNKGYSSRSYSLIGFGKNGIETGTEPQIHFTSNEVWQPLDSVLDSLKTLTFDGNGNYKASKAIEYAIDNLKFDSKSSKVFIVVTLDDSKPVENLHGLTDKLESFGISLYTIAYFPSVEKGKHIFGVRGDGYVFPHPPKAKKEDREVLFVTVPGTPLAKMTSLLKGSIFHRNFLEENSLSAYFTEIADEILAKVSKEGRNTKYCVCVQDYFWSVRSKCVFQ